VPSAVDVLVLGGGGPLGEAWMMGVLAGLRDAQACDGRAAEVLVGTSAGAIVAAWLASGRPPRRPSRSAVERARALALPAAPNIWPPALGAVGPPALAALSRPALAAARPLVALALGATAPAGAAARALALRAVRGGGESGAALRARVARWGAVFDGRLRVAAVRRDDGARVLFGSPGAPEATVASAVAASCAIPGRRAPVVISGRAYVDGAVWSPTNLDAAPAGRQTRVLCLNPLAGMTAPGPVRAMAIVASAAGALEREALLARGARVALIAPDARTAAAIGPDAMETSRRDLVSACGHLQGLAVARAWSEGELGGGW